MPPESLREARDAKLAAAQEKAAKKAATAAAAEAKRLERLEKGRTPPTELFRSSPEYSAWDEQGIPTLDKEGVEVPKSRKKKCQKEWDAQKKSVCLASFASRLILKLLSRRLHDEFLKESSK